MKLNKILAALTLLLIGQATAQTLTEITSIDFKVDNGTSRVEIKADAPLTYTKEVNEQDNQIVLNISGAKLGKMAVRRLDTSSFDSPITLISPYAVDEATGQVRVVVQLREKGTALDAASGNNIELNVARGDMPPSATETAQEGKEPEKAPIDEFTEGPVETETPPPPAPKAEVDVKTEAPPSAAAESANEQPAEPAPPKDQMDQFVDASKTRVFTGTPISLQVRDADVTDVLRLIGEASGFNIVIGEGVVGTITLSLTDVPWDQALDVVLSTQKLGAERSNNVLRIMSLASLTKEKQDQLAAKNALQANAPRVTRIFPISYADLTELQIILNTFGQSGATGAPAGKVSSDKRTNSIIVQDIVENIDRMTKLIELLDYQTPQVMIEAKVIEASETFTDQMNGQLGLGYSTVDGEYFSSFGGGNPREALFGTPGQFLDGAGLAGTSGDGGVFALSPNVSFIDGLERLNAVLNVSETEGSVEVISTPKLVVLNKQKANILQTTPTVFQTQQIVEGVPQIQNQQLEANTSLDVTPTVTNDQSVLMTLTVNRDIIVPDERVGGMIAKRTMTTQVLVESGTTLVIGGIYVRDKTHSEGGFPYLRKIPVLGWFFGSTSNTNTKTELFIFITPRILNTKKAGFDT